MDPTSMLQLLLWLALGGLGWLRMQQVDPEPAGEPEEPNNNPPPPWFTFDLIGHGVGAVEDTIQLIGSETPILRIGSNRWKRYLLFLLF